MKKFILKTSLLFSLFIILTSCNKDDEPKIASPTVTSSTTSDNLEATYTTIKISGNVSSDGGSDITARGVCWDTNPSPTIANDKTAEASNTFTSEINGLIANTTYYFRVYATNVAGTSYGQQQSFRTSSLNDTTWDFLLLHSSTTSWHADVTFNADGTTVYDEPNNPGVYLTRGTWLLNGNVLTYDMDSSSSNTSYQFTGTLSGNTMSGTYTFGTGNKNWSATKY